VSTNITSPDWKQRYSALLALGAITEGPDRAQFLNIIVPGLPSLIDMFNDVHAKVREAISWVISKICEHHADVLANPDLINTIVPLFIERLNDKPRISNQICRAIENLATSIGHTYGSH